MLQPITDTIDAFEVQKAVDECEEILRTIAGLASVTAYESLYKDLAEKSEHVRSADQRRRLEQAMDDVRWAWWREKCVVDSGSLVLRQSASTPASYKRELSPAVGATPATPAAIDLVSKSTAGIAAR